MDRREAIIGRILATNGFEVELPAVVDVIVRDFSDGAQVKAERERVAHHWFVHWLGGKLYYLRLRGGGPNVDGTLQQLKTIEHPWLLRARLEDAVGDRFAAYDPVRLRPFVFLAQHVELVSEAARNAGIDPTLLDGITITPRYELSAKIYEPFDGVSGIGLFVTLSMAHDLSADLKRLQDAGLDLNGSHLVRRSQEPSERRHVGRFARIDGDDIVLMEAHGADRMKLSEVKLEGSKENFSNCLNGLLKARIKAFDDALEDAEARYRLGPQFDTRVEEVGKHLAKKPIEIGEGIEARVGKRLLLLNEEGATCIYPAPPVDYVYDRTGANTATTAWDGLEQFGPYDRVSFPNRSPRMLVVFPTTAQGKVEVFLASLRDGMGAKGPAFKSGFTKVFGLVKLDFVLCPVDLQGLLNSEVETAYREAITHALQRDDNIHAGIVVLQDQHAYMPGLQNPYLRTKALLMTLGIPAQEIRAKTLNQSFYSLSYTLRNFSVSLYAKLNGTPWTVNQDRMISEELVIGMGFAELSGSRIEDRQRHVGITTVFSGDGTYVLGNVSRECAYRDYPEVIRQSMLSVLRDVKKRNNWQPGDVVRVVFHAHRPLKRVDVAKIVFDCTRAIGSEQDIQLAFVTVTHDHPFMLIDRLEKGVFVKRGSELRKGVYAPERGTIATIGRSSRLLAVNSGSLIKRSNTPLPKPLLINVHGDSTFSDVDYLSEQVLKFTSLSWRSVLPVRTPVTIFYSERIADLLGRLRNVPQWSTTALDVKLKYSRWFL